MMRSAFAVGAISVAAMVSPLSLNPALACSLVGPSPYAVDASMQATDHVAPTLPSLTIARLHRGEATVGCTGKNTCDGIGKLVIGVAASDDVTAATDLGYRFSLVAGALPLSLSILLDRPSQVFVADGQMWLHWNDGTDDHEPIDFTLQVTAIDRAGNESAPQSVHIHDDPDGGCAIAHGGDSRSPAAWLALAALILTARRRSGVRSGT